MKKWKIALAAACVCVLITVAYAATAAAGSQNDPLVTLSYLENIFRPQVKSMAEEAVANHKDELTQALNELIDSRMGGSASDSATFKVVTLSNGQTLTGDVGCEIMLRIGTATCVSASSPGLIDTTTGSTLNNGGSLVTNHLYMVTISTRSVKATAGTVKLLVRGPYTIK